MQQRLNHITLTTNDIIGISKPFGIRFQSFDSLGQSLECRDIRLPIIYRANKRRLISIVARKNDLVVDMHAKQCLLYCTNTTK